MTKMKSGVSVKCIDDHFVDEESNPFKASELNLPKQEILYTVRKVIKTKYGKGIRLKEIKNKKYYFDNIGKYKEPFFNKDRFELVL